MITRLKYEMWCNPSWAETFDLRLLSDDDGCLQIEDEWLRENYFDDGFFYDVFGEAYFDDTVPSRMWFVEIELEVEDIEVCEEDGQILSDTFVEVVHCIKKDCSEFKGIRQKYAELFLTSESAHHG